MRSPPVPPFRYMAWAKAHGLAGVRFNLGLSGVAPPSAALLPLDSLGRDLEQRGRHMPPVLAERMTERLGLDRAQLMLTLGTSHAMYLLCAAALSAGDLCLVEHPAYEMLTALPTLFGARVQRFEREMSRAWRPPANLADTIREKRPAMVLLSNPHNPTGVLLSRAELAPIARAADEVGAVLAVDEVYIEYKDEPMAHSAFGLSKAVATASSFTKALGLGTVRLGWICGEPNLIDATLTYNDYISVLYPNPCAWVGLAALDALAELKARAGEIQRVRKPIVERWVESRDDVRWHCPDAGVIAFLELPMADTLPFVEALLAEHETLVVPGVFFEAPGFVRLGFGTDKDILEAGLDRLGSALTAC